MGSIFVGPWTFPILIDNLFLSQFILRQQFVDRHVAPLGHIILILSQPMFFLLNAGCLGVKPKNTNFIVLSLTPSMLESTIYRTRREYANQCTTDEVDSSKWLNKTKMLKYSHNKDNVSEWGDVSIHGLLFQ
jgi:hypothetical protein